MQVDVIEEGTLARKLTVTYTADEVQQRRQTVLRRLSQEVKMPGFRPGRSAVAVVEKRFGAEATRTAEEELAGEGLNQTLRDRKLRPIGPIANPTVERGAGLKLVFAFEIHPPIELPEPTSIAISREKPQVADQEVEDLLNGMARRAGELSELPAGTTLQADDAITISGKVEVDGAEVRAFHDFQHLIGGYPLFGKAPADVIELLKPHGVGAQVSFDTVLPESFKPEAQAGKAAKVAFTVQQAKRLKPAPLDDAFAKRVGLESVEKLRTAARGQLAMQRESQLHQRQLDELMETLIKQLRFEVPPKLLQRMTDAVREDLVRRAETETPGDAAAAADPEKAKAEAAEKAPAQAEETLRRAIILDAIATRYDVRVTREDMEHQLRMAASRSGRSVDEIVKRLQESGKIEQVAEEIRQAKALETLLDLALGGTGAGTAAVAHGDPGHGQPGHVHGPDCNH